MKEYSQKHDLTWLAAYCPQFAVSSKNIKILQEPSEFFETLKELSKTAKKRITLASLYLGTTALEKELVSSIQEGLEKSEGSLQVRVLLDYTRGSRGKENSRTMLLPLVREFSSQVKVSLYHTPKLRGLMKRFLPERWNEVIGLTHLKVYLFDDTLILSGANLSENYFQNRQDRYVVFQNCKELSDYFDSVVSTVSTMSLLLQPNDSVTLHPGWNIHPSEGSYKDFISSARISLERLIHSGMYGRTSRGMEGFGTDSNPADTLVYPALQMYVFGIRQDEKVLERFLHLAEPRSFIKLASGYFNLTSHYMNIILKSSKALYSLLVASPKVNGFYGAQGASGAIPSVYTYIAKNFFHKVLNYNQRNRIELREYERAAWTFHVKGLWYYKPEETLPSVTFIGSPNYGYRSVYKDLEAQVVIVTENKELQMQLHQENQRLFDRTSVIDAALFERPDRRVPFWVKVVSFFMKDFF